MSRVLVLSMFTIISCASAASLKAETPDGLVQAFKNICISGPSDTASFVGRSSSAGFQHLNVGDLPVIDQVRSPGESMLLWVGGDGIPVIASYVETRERKICGVRGWELDSRDVEEALKRSSIKTLGKEDIEVGRVRFPIYTTQTDFEDGSVVIKDFVIDGGGSGAVVFFVVEQF